MEQEMICIVCPQGCRLKVERDEQGEILVSNNNCMRGPIYARKELTDPTRTLTTTIKVLDGLHDQLPVKSKDEIPKDKNFAVMEALKGLQVQAPVECGQVVMSNVLGLGIDIIATRSLSKKH